MKQQQQQQQQPQPQQAQAQDEKWDGSEQTHGDVHAAAVDVRARARDVAGALLPIEYDALPHMWDDIPGSAANEWMLLCRRDLDGMYDAHMRMSDVDTSTTARDKHIAALLLKPRHILQRTAGQKQAARKLKRHLSHLVRQEQQPQSQQQQREQKQEQQMPHAPADADARRIAMAAKRVRDGNVRKAMDALMQSGVMLAVTDAVIDELAALHPACGAAVPTYDDGPVQQRWLSEDDVSRRPERFYDNGSTAGPSGWTGAMIRPLLQNTACRRGLALLFSLIMNGEIRDARLREMLRAARLLPIPKDAGGGVRPIAVGEVMVRIACNFGMARINTRLSSIFTDVQLGMGVPAGVEKCIITAQALLDQHHNDSSIVMISTDIRNAFNTVSRASMMAAIHGNAATRELCTLFEWSHAGASPLCVYEQTEHGKELARVLSSSEGTQQGNVLGSFCFDMSIQSDYLGVQQSHPLVRLLAIHDDLHIIGPSVAAFAAVDDFKARLNARGDLFMRPDKCRVLIPANTGTHVDSITAAAAARQFQVHKGSMPMHGGCVGSSDSMKTAEFERVVRRYDPALRLLRDRRMPSQAAFHLIRQCVVTGVGFHSRVTAPQLTRNVLAAFDERVVSTLAASHRLPDSIITDADRTQLLAFIGIAPCTRVAPVAYLSCVLSCLSSLPSLVHAGALYKSLRTTHRTLTSVSSPCHPTVSSHIPLSFSTTMHRYMKPETNLTALQSKLHHTIKQKDREQIDKRTDEMGRYMRAMLNSTSSKHANIIFRLLPTHPALRLTSDNWNQLARARLLLPSSDNLPTQCPHGNCRRSLPTAAARAHHQHACLGMMAERTLRHNMVLEPLLKLARLGGYVTEKEKRFDNDGVPNEMRELIPDAVMVSGDPALQPLMLDVGVTHPCAQSHLAGASLPTGVLDAARGMLDEKRKKYTGLARVVGYRFIGVIIETPGGMVDEFRALVDGLVEEAQEQQGLSMQQAKELKIFVYGAIAVALHRGNGLLARRMFQVPSIEDMRSRDYSHHAPILVAGA
jgi:hypothetical protein